MSTWSYCLPGGFSVADLIDSNFLLQVVRILGRDELHHVSIPRQAPHNNEWSRFLYTPGELKPHLRTLGKVF